MEANIPSTDEDVQERPGGVGCRGCGGVIGIGRKDSRCSRASQSDDQQSQKLHTGVIKDRTETQRGGGVGVGVGGPCDWCRGHA